MTRNAGTVVLAGALTGDTEVTFSAFMLAIRGRTIRSCQNGMSRMTRDIPRAISLLEAGLITARPIITARYPLEQITAAAEAADRRTNLTGVIVP